MSSSASSSGTTPSKNLASLYECPVCFEYISPPIYQCSNGHIVCSNCSPKLHLCPSCQYPIGTSRNLFMEKALNDIHFPCKFSANGCQVTTLLVDKSAHEENCQLRPIPCACPLKPCKWNGIIDEIVPHFLHKHPAMKITEGDQFLFNIGTKFFGFSSSRCVRLQICHGHQFLLTVTKERKKSDDYHYYDRITAAVQLIGNKIEAKKFSYSLKLSGDHHRLIWEATPLSLNDNLQSAARTHECLVFESIDVGRIFSKDGNLIFDVKIEKIDSV